MKSSLDHNLKSSLPNLIYLTNKKSATVDLELLMKGWRHGLHGTLAPDPSMIHPYGHLFVLIAFPNYLGFKDTQIHSAIEEGEVLFISLACSLVIMM